MQHAETTAGMRSKLDSIDARLVNASGDASDREAVIEASSGAVLRFYAIPKGHDINNVTIGLREILGDEGRRNW